MDLSMNKTSQQKISIKCNPRLDLAEDSRQDEKVKRFLGHSMVIVAIIQQLTPSMVFVVISQQLIPSLVFVVIPQWLTPRWSL